MTPRPSQDVVAFRRTLAAGVFTRWLVTIVMAVGSAMVLLPGVSTMAGMSVLAAATVAYVVLTYRSLQIARDALLAPDYMARGETAEAEKLLTASLRRFSIYPAQRVNELLQLAMVRQTQGRHHDAAALTATIASLRAPAGLQLQAQMLRLEALIEGRQFGEAHHLLLPLLSLRLSAVHAAKLMALRCRYEYEIGAFQHLLHDAAMKAELLAQLPGVAAAEGWARIAVAARQVGDGATADLYFGKAVSLAGAQRLELQFPSQAAELRAISQKLGLN